MAFQGKGIFGGFSGKVGNVVGYRRNGKDIIQAVSRNPNAANNVVMDWQPLTMVDGRGCIIVDDTVEQIGDIGGGNNGARSPYILENAYGGVGMGPLLVNGRGNLGFKTIPNRYNFRFHMFTIFLTDSTYRVFRLNLPVTGNINMPIGSKFRMIANKNTVKIYIDENTGVYNLIWDYMEAPEAGIFGFINMTRIGGIATGMEFARGTLGE